MMKDFQSLFTALIDECVSKSINKQLGSSSLSSSLLPPSPPPSSSTSSSSSSSIYVQVDPIEKLGRDFKAIGHTFDEIKTFVKALKNDCKYIIERSPSFDSTKTTQDHRLQAHHTINNNHANSSIRSNGRREHKNISSLSLSASSESKSEINGNNLRTAYLDEGYTIARKSTAKPLGLGPVLPPRNAPENEAALKQWLLNEKKEFLLVRKPKILKRPKEFLPHRCSKNCVPRLAEYWKQFRDENPYSIPIILGWGRQIATVKRVSRDGDLYQERSIFYLTPCGRRLRNMNELDEYLAITECSLTIDLFTYEPHLELYIEREGQTTVDCYYFENDISSGVENQPVSVINTIDTDEINKDFCYIINRFEGPDVNIPTDLEFLQGCDCVDNCRDKETCKCHQLTIEATAIITGQGRDPEAGYHHRRLPNFLMTGIYECNSNCPCNVTCRNKVVQQGIKARLQIFKTLRRGWGVRCLHDIPEGSFICTYTAEVLTERKATECARIHGDEYLADLDYIDVCENAKENYESAPEEELSSDDDHVSDVEMRNGATVIKSSTWRPSHPHFPSKSSTSLSSSSNHRQSQRNGRGKNTNSSNQGKSFAPIRDLYDEDFSYTLDAKKFGNVGRFLNHSCSPNCFVQSVFIDTHDLRFPWVAFFAGQNIPAFSELTWDYNYEVGSVEGKKMQCYCMSPECRYRLL